MHGSASELAGLKRGDMLLSINGKKLSAAGKITDTPRKGQSMYIKTFWMNSRPGDLIELEVISRGQKKARKLQTRAVSARDRAIVLFFPELEIIDYEVFAGLVFLNLNLNIREYEDDIAWMNSAEQKAAFRFEDAMESKVVIVNVLPQSFFKCKHTAYPGNLVIAVNGKPVHNLTTLRNVLRQVILDHDEEYFVFELEFGGEAVIHKVVAAKQEPYIRATNSYQESSLAKLLAKNIGDMSYESAVGDDCAYVER
jgi:hypothetical protein